MVHLRFQAWCRQAVSWIVYLPDRINVERELSQHMEDRYEELVRQGYSHDDAELMTLEAMGDPEEIAAELGRVYRPFWGLMYSYSRKVLVVMLALVTIAFWMNFADKVAFGGYSSPKYANFNPFTTSRYLDDAGHFDRVYHLTPGNKVSCDEFTVTVTNVALWQYSPSRQGNESNTLYLQLKFFQPIPWYHLDGDVTNWFWAEDDLGNVYSAFALRTDPNVPAVYSSSCQTGLMTYVHDLYLSEFVSGQAQWIKLHYQRAGREIDLHIDLAGGDR